MKFPADAPKAKVLRTLRALGFQFVREREHISMVRQNSDGSRTPLTMPKSRDAQSLNASHELLAVRDYARRFPRRIPKQLIGELSAIERKKSKSEADSLRRYQLWLGFCGEKIVRSNAVDGNAGQVSC